MLCCAERSVLVIRQLQIILRANTSCMLLYYWTLWSKHLFQAKLALMSSQHILISLGDIERYQVQFQPRPNWASIRSWYLKASKLAPKNGKPYNQLGVIAVSANRKLDSVYYYIRSLAVSNPILTAREKLTAIFYDIQLKVSNYSRVSGTIKSQCNLLNCSA